MTHRLSTRSLTTGTLVALAIFPIIVVVLHLIQRNSYDPVLMAVSELALGRGGWLMAVAFCSSAVGMLGFAVVLRRILPGSVVVPGLAVVSALGSAVSAVAHADGETAPASLHGAIHQAAGLTSFATVVIAMFVCAVRFRRDPVWRSFSLPTLLWALCAVAAFLLVPALGPDRFGVAQRIFLVVWLAWPITLVVRVRRMASPTGHPGALLPAGQAARA
jgi:hypothetical protein